MSTYKLNYQYPYINDKHSQAYSYITPALIKQLKRREKLNILELGCGNGYFCNILSKMGHEVVGVDSSETGIEIANKSFPHVRFIKSDIYNLLIDASFSDNYFDAVIALEVIEHLQYPKELIRVARKYLKQGGQLVVSTPYHGYFKNLAISTLNKWDAHFGVSWDVGHLKFFSVKTLKKMFEDEGFQDIRFEFSGRLPPFWKAMICTGKKG